MHSIPQSKYLIKCCHALLLLFGMSMSAHAVTYYYDGSGPANTLGNWWTNPDGTGSNPANFTTADQLFAVQNGQVLTTSTIWSISTANTLLIQNGGEFTSGNAVTAILSMESGSTYRSQSNSTTLVTGGTISPTSTFIYEGVANSTNTSLAYGNLSILNPSAHFVVGGITTTGNFSVSTAADANRMNLTNSVDTIINIGGDVDIASSVKLFRLTNAAATAYGVTLNINGGLNNNGIITNGSATSSINFNGTGSSNVKWGSLTSTYDAKVTIGASKTITFTDSYDSHNNELEVSGTLLLSAASVVTTGSSTFTVKNGGTLGGSGTSSSLVTFEAGSTHAPGNSPGEQTLAGGASYTSATMEWELIGNTDNVGAKGTAYDSVLITGGTFTTTNSVIDLIFNGSGSDVNFANSFWAEDRTWTIVDSTVNRTGDFALGSISLDSLGQDYALYGSFSLDPSFTQDVVLMWTANPVPEPSTVALLVLGVGAFVAYRLRRRSSVDTI